MTAGLMVSGLQALSNERKFDAWMTALLVQPFSRTLLPTTVDESFASSALELSPLTSKHLQGASPNVATELLRASVMLAEDGNLRSCVDLAQELLSDADPIGLRRCFASEVELSEALEEYRASVIFLYARSELSGVIAIPAFAGGPVYVQDMDLLLTRVFMLRKDSRAGEALQKIVRLVQLLSGLHLDPGKLATMVFSGLHTGAEMVTRTVCLSSLLQRAPHADPTTNFTAAGARTASEKQMEASSPSWSS